MASTKFSGTYCLDQDFYTNLNRNVENMESDSDTFKLGFILITTFFIYNFSSKLFSNNKNLIKPLECSYKYLFNFNEEDSESDDSESEEEEASEEEVSNEEASEEEASDDEVREEQASEEVSNEEGASDDEVREEQASDEVSNEEGASDDEVREEQASDDEVREEQASEEEPNEIENKYNEYYELFKEQEFKMLLLNFLKNKEKDLSDNKKLKKYKSLIENLEKDILEYVYVEVD